MTLTANLLQSLFQGGGLDAQLFGGAARASAPVDAASAIRNAEKNKAREVERVKDQPSSARELARFKEKLRTARDANEFMRDPVAMRVLLTANGLGDMADSAQGLARRVLTSDLANPRSAANQLAQTNRAWRNMAQTYDMARRGLDVLRNPQVLAATEQAYAETRWRQSLDQSTPGLSIAMTFRDRAANVARPIEILADGVLREVVTQTLGIPREIARQSLEAQERAITDRLDIAKLKDRTFVDEFARRYLMVINGQLTPGAGGLRA
jgi:hypothetical protein